MTELDRIRRERREYEAERVQKVRALHIDAGKLVEVVQDIESGVQRDYTPASRLVIKIRERMGEIESVTRRINDLSIKATEITSSRLGPTCE